MESGYAGDCAPPSSHSDLHLHKHSALTLSLHELRWPAQESRPRSHERASVFASSPSTPLALPRETATARSPPADQSRIAAGKLRGSKSKHPSRGSCPHTPTADLPRHKTHE